MLRDANVEFEPGRIEPELVKKEDSRPDLTIHDRDGRVRVLVENKFWAGLTKKQPVSYLGNLPADPPSALMFVVPPQRLSTVWRELEKRCRDEHLDWTDTSNAGSVKCACVSRKTMLIASWDYVLGRLLDAARREGHDTVAHDILQLQGLTDRENLEAFLPLRDDEANNQDSVRRLMNYIDLYGDILNELENDGYAYKKGFGAGIGLLFKGVFFSIREDRKIETWLGVDFREWRDAGITPLWWWFRNKSGVSAQHFKTNPELFAEVRFHQNGQYVPIRLKSGVERERVIEDAVAQMKRIADNLLANISND